MMVAERRGRVIGMPDRCTIAFIFPKLLLFAKRHLVGLGRGPEPPCQPKVFGEANSEFKRDTSLITNSIKVSDSRGLTGDSLEFDWRFPRGFLGLPLQVSR